MSVANGFISNECPVDLHPLVPVAVTTPEDVKAIVAVARTAQNEWNQLGFEKRAKALELAAKRILKRRQEVLELLHDETGKTPGDVLMGEALGALQFVTDWVKVARPHLKPRTLPMSPIAFSPAFKRRRHRAAAARRGGASSPRGTFRSRTSSSPSSRRCCAATRSCSSRASCLRAWERGSPPVLGEVLPPGRSGRWCRAIDEVGQALIRAGIDAVTRSEGLVGLASGRAVAKLCAERLIPVSLELGGKDAALVLEDCELDRTVAGIMYWSLANAGQACGAIERVFVEDSIADHFVETLSTAVARLRVTADARTSDVGPLANARQLEIVEAQVKEAIAQGATLKCGGRRTGDGLWFEPTVLDHCTPSMKVMREPTFGPVISVARVANADTAVTRVNDCDYGLNASVWSREPSPAPPPWLAGWKSAPRTSTTTASPAPCLPPRGRA